jgi:hypothetical protein
VQRVVRATIGIFSPASVLNEDQSLPQRNLAHSRSPAVLWVVMADAKADFV